MNHEKSSSESSLYAAVGASSSKAGVHSALSKSEGSERENPNKGFFAEVQNDVAGDPTYFSLLHADGAGTKSIPAYIAFKETGDPKWFRSIAYDSLIMNLDDVACVGAFEGLLLSNTIGRNRNRIPDEAIGHLIGGYRELTEMLRSHGIELTLAGGETADLGDLVRTIVVDSTLFARVKRAAAITTHTILPGDIIVGLSSTGRASFETSENSGIGSNGISLARHALIAKKYAEKYPEILDETTDPKVAYQGSSDLFSTPAGSSMPLVEALLSPTRTYAPILKRVIGELKGELHGAVHCSGGGQTKVLRFGKNCRYIKDSLFACPPLFSLIQSSLNVPWNEMYSVFNMGHRMELFVPENRFPIIRDIAASYNIEAKRIGYVEQGDGSNSVEIRSPHGTFSYRLS